MVDDEPKNETKQALPETPANKTKVETKKNDTKPTPKKNTTKAAVKAPSRAQKKVVKKVSAKQKQKAMIQRLIHKETKRQNSILEKELMEKKELEYADAAKEAMKDLEPDLATEQQDVD